MKKQILPLIYFIVFMLAIFLRAEAKEAQFIITGPGLSKSFTRNDLMKSKDIKTIIIEKDPAYKNTKQTYLAIPLAKVFAGIPMESVSTMSFKCLDGFSGALSKARALSTDPKGSIAYLAIEKEQEKWPKLNPQKMETAGPFYLIWENPEKSKIMTEEWPFQLAGFELSNQSYDDMFPQTKPAADLKAGDPILNGHALFMTNCFVCHAFNSEGAGKIGPDLNLPFSPSEYMNEKYFLPFVRNPQSLRKWDQERMPSFNSNGLSDKDIGDIWSYFSHMAKRKKPTK